VTQLGETKWNGFWSNKSTGETCALDSVHGGIAALCTLFAFSKEKKECQLLQSSYYFRTATVCMMFAYSLKGKKVSCSKALNFSRTANNNTNNATFTEFCNPDPVSVALL
jgi:hypothetical protein